MKFAYDFDRMPDRRGTYSIKWDCLPPGAPPGTLPLWIADMDLPTARPILDAIRERVEREAFGYTNYRDPEVLSAVTGWYRRRFGWEIEPDSLFYSPGVMPGVAFLLDILSEEGDGVVIQPPVYQPFTKKIEAAGRRVVKNPLLCRDGAYSMDYAGLEEAFRRPDVKGLILCSPHNPVGRVWTPEELRRTAELAAEYGKWIICDEIHGDIVRRGVVHHPLLAVCPEHRDRIALCTAPSKTFNLAGLLISNIVIPNPAWRKAWEARADGRYGIADPSPLSLAAMTAAYREGEDWLEQLLDYLDGNLAFARRYLGEHLPAARSSEPQGTYLLWTDLRGCFPGPEEPAELLLRKARVALNSGALFGAEGSGFVRINAACPRALLEECLRRMAAAAE